MKVLSAILILTTTTTSAFAAPGVPFVAYGPPSQTTIIEDHGSRRASQPGIVPETPGTFPFLPSRRDEYPYPTATNPASSGFEDSSQELVLPSDQPQSQPQPQSQQQPQQPTSKLESSPSKSSPIILPPGTKLKVEDDRGQYSHGFSSPDGTEVQETGRLITTNGGWEYVIAKEGSYRYNSPEGVPITVRYIADHNGYRIIGQTYGR